MDLLQLEHFLAVVEERSFTRAAERVFRTQPAVTQSIKKLEDALGARLFAHDMPDVSLTEAGRVLVDYARRMLRLRDEATHRVSELQNLSSGSLSIAAHESAALYLLPGPMRQYFERCSSRSGWQLRIWPRPVSRTARRSPPESARGSSWTGPPSSSPLSFNGDGEKGVAHAYTCAFVHGGCARERCERSLTRSRLADRPFRDESSMTRGPSFPASAWSSRIRTAARSARRRPASTARGS